MTDLWFKTKEIVDNIKLLESYLEAWNFIKEVADGDLYEAVDKANALIEKFREVLVELKMNKNRVQFNDS